MKILFSFLALLFLSTPFLSAQKYYYTPEDSMRVEACLKALRECRDTSPGARMLSAARLFLDIPYVASTLEREPEGLVINLRGLDCTTLVETALALSQTAGDDSVHPSFQAYCEVLRHIRYRDGIVAYVERLHYISDWKEENGKRSIVQDITSTLPGSQSLPLRLSFISSHPQSYPPLVKHPEWISAIKQRENSANLREYSYLPKEKLSESEPYIRDGDILGFVTSVPGLDVTHLGIACREGGKLTFLHASSSARKVIVNPVPLREYLGRMKNCKGVWVIRVLK